MKVSSKQGKELADQVNGLKKGEKVEFGEVFKGLPGVAVGHCTETEENRWWQFALYWHGVHLADVTVERHGDEITAEVL